MTINFTGNGERRVRIGYVVETPVWKTSYRLLLDDKGAEPIQGWAIVENQTESDWNNVSLSLVSGRPISFMMDLYQPLYVPRPPSCRSCSPACGRRSTTAAWPRRTSTQADAMLSVGSAGSAAIAAADARGPLGSSVAMQLEEVVVTTAASEHRRRVVDRSRSRPRRRSASCSSTPSAT